MQKWNLRIRYFILEINLSIKIFSEEMCMLKFSARHRIVIDKF